MPVLDHAGKTTALPAFYMTLLGRSMEPVWHFDLAALYAGAPSVDGPALVAPFEQAEVKAAVHALDRTSAPARMAWAQRSTRRPGAWWRQIFFVSSTSSTTASLPSTGSIGPTSLCCPKGAVCRPLPPFAPSRSKTVISRSCVVGLPRGFNGKFLS